MRFTWKVILMTPLLMGCAGIASNDLPQQEVVVTRGDDPRGIDKVYEVDFDGETIALGAGQTLRRDVPIGRYTVVATTDPGRLDLRPFLNNVPFDRASLGIAVYGDRRTVVEIETGPLGGPLLTLVPQSAAAR
ncbi:MAG: hypothetical protein AAGK37_09925 [Pseudomonadota bacterium]